MLEILTKLNELVGICEARVKKFDQEKAELAGKRINLAEVEKKQNAREDEIKKEDEALGKKKLLVQTIEEAKALLKKNNDEKERLKIQSDEFEARKANHEKKMAEELSEIARQKEKVAAMNAETEKMARDYKIKVMDEILKNSIARAVNQ